MKNPDLPYPSIAAALRAYGYVLSSLDVRTPWEPLLPLLGHTVLAYYLIAILLLFASYILAIPYILSLV